MKLPKAYQWLAAESGPRHLLKAVELMGVTETVGAKHNPIIMGWARELGMQNVYTADEIPWCGLFMAIIMQRADRSPVANPLRALAWNNFGNPVQKAELADVLTFTRKGGGHVGLYVGEDWTHYHVLGGNQGNGNPANKGAVSIVRIHRNRLSQIRRVPYTAQPNNIRQIWLASNGVVSTNEA